MMLMLSFYRNNELFNPKDPQTNFSPIPQEMVEAILGKLRVSHFLPGSSEDQQVNPFYLDSSEEPLQIIRESRKSFRKCSCCIS